jgi:signal transduction histidine kinase
MLLGSRATFSFATLNVLLIIVISLVAGRGISLESESYYSQVISIVIPPAILCYLMALVAWLYGNSLEKALKGLAERSQQLQIANEEIYAFSRTLEDKVEERTQELREFVSMVAHDLRNPLTTVWGYIEMLAEQGEEASEDLQERAYTTIIANVQHMVHMTDNLLEISRLQSGRVQFEMESLPIEHIIQEVCKGFEPRLNEKRLDLRIDLPPGLPPVWGDRFRLTQVLNNLIGNACNYTPSGMITVGARSVNGGVEVSVSDTGIGIPLQEQKRLFTRFFRGDHQVVRHQKGTGLGLTITQSIVQAHGGDISVESQVDKGTTFRFTVPVA